MIQLYEGPVFGGVGAVRSSFEVNDLGLLCSRAELTIGRGNGDVVLQDQAQITDFQMQQCQYVTEGNKCVS